jgi:hypothetical protein
MSTVVATWEAQIRRTEVPGQPRGKNPEKQFMRAHCNRKKQGIVVSSQLQQKA